jgi:hypothetical protein
MMMSWFTTSIDREDSSLVYLSVRGLVPIAQNFFRNVPENTADFAYQLAELFVKSNSQTTSTALS